MTKTILAIDVGTQGSRAAVVSASRRLRHIEGSLKSLALAALPCYGHKLRRGT